MITSMDRGSIYNFIEIDGQSCWNWTRAKNNKGYGVATFETGGTHKLVHRVSYELANGTIPAGKNICHVCDNPACINPAHLFCGTQKENMQDCKKKGRASKPPRHPHPAAKLTKDLVREIKQRLAAGEWSGDIAVEYGVIPRSIRNILNGVSWKNV